MYKNGHNYTKHDILQLDLKLRPFFIFTFFIGRNYFINFNGLNLFLLTSIMNAYYSIVLFFLSFFITHHIFSQTQQILDSLTKVIESEVSDTERLKAYKVAVEKLELKDSVLTDRYMREGIKLSEKLDDEESMLLLKLVKGDILLKKSINNVNEVRGIYKDVLAVSKQKKFYGITSKVLHKMSHSYYIKNDYSTAISFLLENLIIYESLSDKTELEFPFKSLAGFYWLQKNYKKAIFYTQKRLEDNELRRDPFVIADSYNLMGILYASNGNKQEALVNFKKSIEEFTKLGDKKSQALILSNMGSAYYFLNNYDQALINYQHSLQLYTELKNEKMMMKAMDFIGMVHLNLKQQDSAFYYFDQSLNFYKNTGDVKMLIGGYQRIGKWYFAQGQLSKTLQLYYDALKDAEKFKDTFEIANMYHFIADVHSSQGNSDEAITYEQKALINYNSLQDSSRVAKTKNNISELLINTKKYTQALSYSKEALKQFQSFQDSCSISESYLTIGKAYFGLKQLDSAKYYLNNVVPLASMCNKSEITASAYITLGQIYKFQNQENTALIAFEKAVSYAKVSQDRQIIKEATESLYPLYQQKGQYKKAFETLNLYQANKDSLFNQENTRSVIQKEVAYDFEKKQQEESFLQKQKEIEQNQVYERQRWIIYIATLGCFALVGTAFSFYRNSQNKKKANELLIHQNLEISKQKKELEKLHESKSRLYANISHELRTPLTLISSPIQYMLANEKNQFNENQVKQLKMVERNVTQLKGLVNDILDLSKLESNKLELQEEELAIVPFLQKVASNFHSLAQHLGITYEMNLDIPNDTFALLDREKVEKIINNLLSNAIKHTSAGGLVKFSASIKKNTLHFQVIDTGYGIPEEDVPYIFDRFFQSKNSQDTLQGGTGIGLALAKELTQLMNGQLTVHSELKKGSTFSLMLAYKEVTAPKIDATVFEEDEVSNFIDIQNETLKTTHKHTILIVEDHPDMQRFIHQLLANQYQTFVANNGKQALEILAKEAIDLVVSDVMMPEMNGYELLQELKNHDSYFKIPVVMLTALKNEDSKLKALTIGVDDYVSKPFSPEELMARVANLLQRYEVRQTVAKEIAEEAKELQIEAVASEALDSEQDIKQKDLEWLKKVESSIRSELENAEFNIGSLAETFFLSQRQFQRKMKQITGLTPKKFQQEVALQESRKLLENKTFATVKAIAYSMGMSNVWRFSQLYEQRFGKNPSDYF